MVKLVFKSANQLKDVIGLVSCMNDEVRFLFDENGFMTRVMDPGKVAMVSLTVKKDFLQEYDLSGQQKADMTISLSQLEKLLRSVSKNPVSLEVKPLRSNVAESPRFQTWDECVDSLIYFDK